MRMTRIKDGPELKGGYCFRDREERPVEVAMDFTDFLEESAELLAPRTKELYARAVYKLCAFLETHTVFGRETVDAALKDLNRRALNALFRHLQRSGAQPATVSIVEAGVRRFCRWANSDLSNYLHARPLFAKGERRSTASPSKNLPRALPFNKVVDLALACHFEAQRLVIHAMYDTGLRISEIPRVMKADLPDPQRYPDEWNYFGLHVKGSKGRGQNLKERKTLISRVLLARISRHHKTKAFRSTYTGDDARTPAFTNVFGEPWTEDALESLFRKARRRAGFDEAHAHMLRHGFALSVLGSEHGRNAVENLIIVNQALGHSDLKTTQKYTRLTLEALTQLINAMGTEQYENRFEQQQELFDKTFIPERKQPAARRIRAAP